MKIFSFVFVLFASLNAIAQHSPCDYYVQKAQALRCDNDNYLIKFGYRYCKVFEEREHTFSAQAQPILDHIRSCLILTMDQHLPTCATTENIGFGSHMECYINNGFCEMPEADKLHILWIVRAQITNPTFRYVVGQIDKQCRARQSR